MSDHKIKVLYIAGSGRNGSTILARLLGQIEGFLSIGEATRYLFDEKMSSREIPCGCGREVSECGFWSDILSNVEIKDEVRKFATNYARMRYIPLILFPLKQRLFKNNIQELLTAQGNFFSAIKSISRCHVIVDSSKNPANAFLLRLIPGIDLYVVHLVRDVRGFVSSWQKPKGYLQSFPIHKTTLWWISYNFYSDLLRFFLGKYKMLRYEDFVRNPNDTLFAISEWIGENKNDQSFLNNYQVKIALQHLLGSNPDKLSGGEVKIRNRYWNLPRIKQYFVTLMAFPFLVRYRYPIIIKGNK